MPFLLGLLIAQCNRLTAGVMLAPGTTLPGQAYIDFGAQWANSMVAVKTVSPVSGTVRYGSGVQIDPFTVITAAHVLDSAVGFRPFANVFIVGGSNYSNPSFVSDVTSYVTHPSYVQGSGLGTGSQIDLAVIKLATPQYNRGVQIHDSVANGAIADLAGFGQFGTSANSLNVQDGNLRAFNAILYDPSSLFDNYFYGSTYATSSSQLNLPGYGANYDSGGGVYIGGKLVGLMTAASDSGFTTFLDITTPEIKSFINQFRTQPGLPRVTLNIMTNTVNLSFASLLPSREYRVMRSSTLTCWEEAHRFTAVAATGSWGEAPATGGKMFYRLEWNE